ncbi:MAG: SDR family NAD(P)-dependent oxidoreductase [Pirellulaceae bacterium]|nr:SDR family NAD(P)-dependent oxidoreductase [Pirellulaceae bacterium]
MATEDSNAALTPLQNAVYLLKQAQAKLASYERARSEPIAVVGLGCRFPQADSPTGYWRLLSQGTDAIREVPADRWDLDEYYDPDSSVPGKMYTRWGGFLERMDEFDADFFGISPREAIRVDPQQRLLLEVAWEALENAGIPPASLAESRTGVYVGAIGNDYALLQSRDLTDMDIFSGTGVSHSVLANRLSYILDLHGPSVALDTACSSSLVTVHLACRSLRDGESDLALAGGVNLLLGPATTIGLCKAQMMSPDGRCKAFDAAADGYVRGEGCGMVVLKRLRDASAAGDRVLAVIRGTAVNHDGRSNGLSAPNGPAQESVLRAALLDAHLSPLDIGYIEAHGTGTRLGDPIEIEALKAALCQGRSPSSPLMLGSVKTNIGHLESAAGIAGLIKLVLMLRHGQIPPHLHLKNPNPLLAIENSPLVIPTQLQTWTGEQGTRRAGVSSFGFGGTNAHVIVEEAPQQPVAIVSTDTPRRPRHLWTASARSTEALDRLAEHYADFLTSQADEVLADLAFTANTGRTHFTHRAAVVAATLDEARDKFLGLAADPLPVGVRRGVTDHHYQPRVAFLFTGQGAQYAGMGRSLYETQPTFRRTIDRCAECLDGLLDRPLLSLLDPEVGSLLDQTGYTQPVMFALEYALAELWRSWGVEPAALMGHSVGEFAAACIAGVYELEDGLRLIAERARLMQSLPPGGLMAAVFATPGQVARMLNDATGEVSIAAYNGPQSVVISGDETAVRRMLAAFDAEGIKSKPLVTSHAFHSQLLDPILEPLGRFASTLTSQPPRIPLISNLTGQPADERTYADPSYWVTHARSPVQFAMGMQTLADSGCDVFLEIGPAPTLIGMGQRCVSGEKLRWLTSLRPGRDDWQTVLESLAELYVAGVPVDWRGFDRDYSRRLADLPHYPFQRKRYWAKSAELSVQVGAATSSRRGPALHPLLGHRLAAAISDRVFEAQVAANRPSILADHKIQGVVVMPGAAYLEMALAASAAVYGQPWEVCEAALVEPLLLNHRSKTVQTIVTPQGDKAATFRIVSFDDEAGDDAARPEPVFKTHAVGRLEAPGSEKPADVDVQAQQARFSGPGYDDAWRIEAERKSGLDYGPSFCWSPMHWRDGQEAWAHVREARDSDHAADYRVPPGLLDGGFQLLGATLPGAGTGIDAYVPMTVGRLRLHDSVQNAAWYQATLKSLERDYAIGDLALLDASGHVVMEVCDLRLRRVPRDWLARLVAEPQQQWTYQLAWQEQPVVGEPATSASHEPGRWLAFESCDGLGAALAERLELKGHTCEVISPADPEARRAAVCKYLSESTGLARGIVYLSSADIDGQAAGQMPDFSAARDHGWGGVLDVLQAIQEMPSAQPPRFWVVTRGAQPAGDVGHAVALAQSPLWGLGRVIATEHPELSCTRIDLDPRRPADEADLLIEDLLFADREDQVAYRDGKRLAARLRPAQRGAAGELTVPRGQPYRLEIISRGQLDQVELRGVPRLTPGPGQVEIQVRATGLNFRDVLNVLNLYPGDPGPLGGECAGEVIAVGDGVEHVKPGDQVIALAPASFSSYALTLGQFVVRKPESLTCEEGATIPIAFLSAYYALCRLGCMKAGERVLIHAASGGVGLAAIQLAQQAGAEIFATAGSPKKRDYLKALGIQHVMDSRSTDFAAQIMELTGGEGIDLVLNSLTGETIGSSLSVLRDGGRFLELGKTDLWDQARVDAFRPGLTFHAIALDHMMAEQPDLVRELMQEVVPQFEDQRLQPLPLRTFPVRRVVDALRHMARAEHIGKVVIEAEPMDAADQTFWLREDGTYLVTGGLGGLGLALTRWLAQHGARHLVLTGRSAPTDEAAAALKEIEEAGVRIEVRRNDISCREQVTELLASIAGDLPPLRGVFHLAGVLDDGVLREQTRERFDRVMAAKVLGAWHLHELTADLPLEQFVLFSSAAALLGSPGQGNYAAANAFLDALAHQRRAEGRPGLSINWGSWAEVGMAARLRESQGSRWSEAGIGWIDLDRGFHTMEELLADDAVQVGVLPVNWKKFFSRIPPGAEPAWLSDLASQARAADGGQSSGPPVLLEKLKAVTAAERLEVATTFLQQQAAQVLAMDAAQLPDARRPLNELGFDSLTGVEFGNRVARATGQHLNPTLLFDYPTLESLAGYIVREMLHLECGPAGAPSTASAGEAAESDEAEAEAAREQVVGEIEGMTDEQIDALMSEQLNRLQAEATTP